MIKLELELNEVNQILGALAERPYRESAQLIQKLAGLTQPQLASQEKSNDEPKSS